MAQIIFTPGLDTANLPPARLVHMLDLAELQRRFENLRYEWILATDGNLESVTVNLGALLADVESLIRGNDA